MRTCSAASEKKKRKKKKKQIPLTLTPHPFRKERKKIPFRTKKQTRDTQVNTPAELTVKEKKKCKSDRQKEGGKKKKVVERFAPL